jgi:WD40 repeat protein
VYENSFKLKRYQSVLSHDKKSNVVSMAILYPLRGGISTTLLVTLNDKSICLWNLYETTFLKELVCQPGNEQQPIRVVKPDPSPAVAPAPVTTATDGQVPAVAQPVVELKFNVTALASYTPSDEHKEIGRKIIICGGNDTRAFAFIWDEDLQSGDILFPFGSEHHAKHITAVLVMEPKKKKEKEGVRQSTERPIVVIASADKSFSVWDLKEKKSLWKISTHHTDLLLSITVLDRRNSHRGLLFITGGWDKNIFSYEMPVRGIFPSNNNPVNNNNNGTNSNPDSPRDNSNQYLHNYKGHKKSVTVVYAHYLRGNANMKEVSCGVLVTGSLDKTVIVWDVETKEKVRILKGHDQKITGISIFEREEGTPPVIITCSEDCKTILWDLLSGDKLREMVLPEKAFCQTVMSNLYGMIMVTGCAQGKAVVTNLCRTERIRKFWTKAVTAIATYTPREGDPPEYEKEPTILIGDINNSCSLFKLHSHKKIINVYNHHTSRINAAVIFTPPIPKNFSYDQNNSSKSNSANPLVVSCDGTAVICVWDLFQPQVLKKTLKEHNGTVMTVAIFDPNKIAGRKGVLNFDDQSVPDSTKKIDLNQPIIISGGSDCYLRFWYLMDNSTKPFHSIEKAHNGMIRSMVVHHPQQAAEDPFVITGSYDHSVALWNLRTLTEITRLKVHDDYVFFIGLYDPFVHLGDTDIHHHYHHKKDVRDELLNNLVLVTSSYDKTMKVLAIEEAASNIASPFQKQSSVTAGDGELSPRSKNSQTNVAPHSKKLKQIHHLKDQHRDSVTALTIYTPDDGSLPPLIISGSIDRMIIVWNLFTGEPVQKLIGHNDRVCFITTFLPVDGKNPLVLSGADDESSIVWEDALYEKPFMPLRDDVNRNFYSDCLEEDWPLITELAEKYETSLFLVNSNLFYLAVKYNRPDFLVKFQKYLSKALPHMHDYNGSNLLTFAVAQNDLLSVRIILSCWIENLNKDISDVLTQRMYHASYFFPDKDLTLLAKKYPVEFKNFIVSLRLIRNHSVLLLNDFETPAGSTFQLKHEDHHSNHLEAINLANNSGKRNSQANASPTKNGIALGLNLSLEFTNENEGQSSHCTNGIPDDAIEQFEKETLLEMNQTRVLRLHPVDRYEVEATYNTIPRFNDLWIKKFITTTYYDFFLSQWSEFVNDPPDPQPVTSLMIPLRNTATKEALEHFVTVSNQLDNEEIFNSEVGYVSLRYFWDSKAKFYHLNAFCVYLVTLLLYNIALYTFEVYYLAGRLNASQKVAQWVLNAAVMFLLCYYFYEEIAQFAFAHQLQLKREKKSLRYSSTNLAKERKKTTLMEKMLRPFTGDFSIVQQTEEAPVSPRNRTKSLFYRGPTGFSAIHDKSTTLKKITVTTMIRFFLEHFLLDLWNLVDLSITFTAGIGILLRFIMNDDVPFGRSLLAVGSILLWFKILYFLRPFSNSGPLGEFSSFHFICFLFLISFLFPLQSQ